MTCRGVVFGLLVVVKLCGLVSVQGVWIFGPFPSHFPGLVGGLGGLTGPRPPGLLLYLMRVLLVYKYSAVEGVFPTMADFFNAGSLGVTI